LENLEITALPAWEILVKDSTHILSKSIFLFIKISIYLAVENKKSLLGLHCDWACESDEIAKEGDSLAFLQHRKESFGYRDASQSLLRWRGTI